MRTTVVLFTRDLRLHDHPALHEAQRRGKVVPAFVLDDAILESSYGRPNRVGFLIDSLRDLDASLKSKEARLVIRRGDVVAETMGIAEDAGADALFMSADYSKYARTREQRLGSACEGRGIEFRTFDGVSVVAPGDVTPANGDHFKVFTPYFSKWKAAGRRSVHEAPRSLDSPSSIRSAVSRPPTRSCPAIPLRRLRPAARTRDENVSTTGSAPGSQPTPRVTTTSRPTTPRVSARICTLVASPRATSSSEHEVGREARTSSGRSAGETSTIRFWR